MAIRFDQITTQDPDIRRIQDNIQRSIVQLQTAPFLSGNLLTAIVLTAGSDNLVAHGLQRQPILWVLADQDTNSVVWRSAWDESYLTLQCSSTCTVNLWVA